LALVSLTPLLLLPSAGVVGTGGWSTMNVPVSSEPVTCWSVLEPADSVTSSREFSVVMPVGLPGPGRKIQKIKGEIPQPGGFLAAGVADGTIRASVDPNDLLLSLGGITLVAAEESRPALVGRLIALLLGGVLT
jgi:hypothetical protein